MHNLNSIVLAEESLGPFAPPHDIAIQFDCDPRGRQRQLAHEIFQSGTIGYLATLSIDLNLQVFPWLSFCREDYSTQLGRFAAAFGLNEERSAASVEVGQRN